MKEPDPPVYFGEWLKRRRKALDLTQAELAQCAGCSVFAVRKIETGERRPSKQLAALLADCLNIPFEDQETFIRVARGELYVDRLDRSSFEPAAGTRPTSPPAAPPTNLSASPTPLVGREPEMVALSRLLHDPQCRLLTLLGPGGIGKTRLAIEVASRHQEHFQNGTFFVSLASINSSAFLVPAIADALSLTFQGQVEPRIQLLNYLRGKEVLLVLDNAEHLLDGVGLFSEMLECAPKLNLLVTSRERLNLQGEWLFEIQGLPVPPIDQAGHAEEYSSVALFVQSARRAKIGFELEDRDRPAVVRICQILEGMPLGIELAAAWVSVLTCVDIADEIEQSLDFLTSTMRDIPERQRSLRAAFDHSWGLLSADERQALGRLAIFQGGFEREAAEQVACATLNTLQALVSKSLLHRSESGRFDLHEVIRQYALFHLDDDPHSEAARDRHCDFYLTMLRDREKALKGPAQCDAIRELKGEIDNVRVAWDWAVKREKFVSIEGALRSFALLSDLGGQLHQGVELLELVIQAIRAKSEDVERQRVLGQTLTQQGDLLFRQGYFDQAMVRFEESLSITRPIGDPALMMGPLIFGTAIMHHSGEIERSQSLLDEGLACARAAGDQWFMAYALFNQGFIGSLLGRYAEGYEQMLAGLDIWRALGDPRYTALGLNFISPTAIHLGCLEEAQAFLQESLTLCTHVGDRWGMGNAYRNMGLAALAQGNIDEAKILIHKSLEIFAGVVTGWDIVQSHAYLAKAAAAAGDLSEARQIYLEALPKAKEIRVMSLVLDILVGLAELDAGSGETQRALELSIFAMNHASSNQMAKDRADQIAAQAKDQLTEHQIHLIRERAKTQSLETIIADTLGEDLVPASH
ncbi:MAG: helix-turn-helix domain-containing protein [Chloroflexota bacterium]|jgi:predicted ATPase/transcriptional regulator with XRE-family HTH domain/tetratricopeptide (TPR) repeat protein